MMQPTLSLDKRNYFKPALLARALRLPFVSASLIPFIFGSFIDRAGFNAAVFLLGLICVFCTHLSANLLNDYADSRSGVDSLDGKFYGFFGGSKLIQEKVFSEGFYLRLALLFLCISLLCAFLLYRQLKDIRVVYLYSLIALLGVAYSLKPFALSYRYLGEVLIFLLFGPGICMGGYFLQTGIFPDVRSFLLSVPPGLLVANILFANEIPDHPQDKQCKKLNLVSLAGQGCAWRLYLAIHAAAFFMVALNIALGFLKPWALLSLLFIPLVLKAGRILKKDFLDKEKLIESARLTIALQTAVSLTLIVALFL